ncbi:MAG: hypothetical protein H0U76_31180 [Ktedonobacteraceae bacterium]|nr:hypothetical protein [Ktedonobacteraceae bacterium]MBA3946752.1 hypothetical protein [Herpetosiphonaceae bacterium]
MERYLLFDAGCSVCSSLAAAIEQEAAGKLKVLNLRSEDAKQLLEQVFPNGWQHQPYLVTVRPSGVIATTGLKMAVGLGQLIGPQKGWRIYRIAKQGRLALPDATSNLLTQRRQFLKRSGLFAGALFFSRFGSLGKLITAPTNTSVIPVQEAKWRLVDKKEAAALMNVALVSNQAARFKEKLAANMVLDPKGVVLARGDQAYTSFQVRQPNNTMAGGFTALIGTSPQRVEQDLACEVENTAEGHRAQVWVAGRLVIDTTITDAGKIIRGWALNDQGQEVALAGKDYYALGQAQLTTFHQQLATDLAEQAHGATTRPNSISCIQQCLASQGIAAWIVVLIGVVCGVACASTLGLGCFICLGSIALISGGVIGWCLGQCGY